VNHSFRNGQGINDFTIDRQHVARGDRTHRQLRLLWHAELADYHHIEFDTQRNSDFISHRHAAARQCQDDGIIAVGIVAQPISQ
jgi:hypothetical protein